MWPLILHFILYLSAAMGYIKFDCGKKYSMLCSENRQALATPSWCHHCWKNSQAATGKMQRGETGTAGMRADNRQIRGSIWQNICWEHWSLEDSSQLKSLNIHVQTKAPKALLSLSSWTQKKLFPFHLQGRQCHQTLLCPFSKPLWFCVFSRVSCDQWDKKIPEVPFCGSAISEDNMWWKKSDQGQRARAGQWEGCWLEQLTAATAWQGTQETTPRERTCALPWPSPVSPAVPRAAHPPRTPTWTCHQPALMT